MDEGEYDMDDLPDDLTDEEGLRHRLRLVRRDRLTEELEKKAAQLDNLEQYKPRGRERDIPDEEEEEGEGGKTFICRTHS